MSGLKMQGPLNACLNEMGLQLTIPYAIFFNLVFNLQLNCFSSTYTKLTVL